MKFTDEQLMLYADGNLDKKNTSEIEKALKKDKKLFDRILTFKLANEAMFDVVEEQETMSSEFFKELQQTEKKTLERQTEKKKPERQSIVSRFIKGVVNFDPLPTGFASAAAAGFALVITFQVQTSNNENLARDFFASMERVDSYTETDKQKRETIVVANIKEYASEVITRGDYKEITEDKIADDFRNDENLQLIVYSEDNKNACPLPNAGALAIDSNVEVKFTSPTEGNFTLLYVDSSGIKKSVFSRPNIPLDVGDQKTAKFTVKEPLGKDYFQYILEKKTMNQEKIETGLFNFETIDTSANKFASVRPQKFIKKPTSIFSRGTSIETKGANIGIKSLKVTAFGQLELADISENVTPAIWEKNGSIFIDVIGDSIANIVSINLQGNKGSILIIDRNGNQQIDAMITPFKVADGRIFYQWLLDENEDGKADLLANDCNGNWELDQIFPL